MLRMPIASLLPPKLRMMIQTADRVRLRQLRKLPFKHWLGEFRRAGLREMLGHRQIELPLKGFFRAAAVEICRLADGRSHRYAIKPAF